jgi:hypothetical protein
MVFASCSLGVEGVESHPRRVYPRKCVGVRVPVVGCKPKGSGRKAQGLGLST